MAVPCGFDEETDVLDKPDSMSLDQCSPLSVFRGLDAQNIPVIISCWKLTAEELAEVNRTGRVWLGVVGVTMPPVWIVGETPFVDPGTPPDL